ncbi:MAG: oligosaccharide flippase family protein [Bacteroidota bacterium]
MDNPIKKLASQTAVYGLSSIIGRFLNYLLTPLYTYSFVPQEFGVVVELYTYTSFLAVILTYGMETAFFRFSESQKDSNSVFSTATISILITTFTFLLLGIFLHQNIANFLGYSQNTNYIIWFILIIAIDALTAIPFAKLRQQNKALKFALIRLVNIGVNIFLNIFFIVWAPKYFAEYWFYSPTIGVGYIFIANLLASFVTLIMLLPEFKFLKNGFSILLWKQMIKYAFPLLIAGLAGMINETMDRVLLKFLLPANSNIMEQIGIYGACYKISIIMTIFIQTYRYAAEPYFFNEHKKSDAKNTYAQTMKYFFIVCMFIFLLTTFYLDIVKLFIGEAYREGLNVVPILLLANLALGVFFNLSVWYKLSGQTKFGAYLTILGAVITIVANFILIPILGYTGAAWATLICYFVMTVTSYFIGQKFYIIPYDLKKIGLYFALGMLFYFVDYYFVSPTYWGYFIKFSLLLLYFVSILKTENVLPILKKNSN